MNNQNIKKYAPIALVVLCAAIAIGSYLQALGAAFFAEDVRYVPANSMLANLPWTELWRLFAEPYNSSFEYLPLRDFSYWLDIHLFGGSPSASRLHNILLYLLTLPLLYLVTLRLWRYFRPADDASAVWAAAAVTALFAMHPALVESVVWISGRKYVLPNLFAALSLWLAVSAGRERGLSMGYAMAALLAFVALMLSKSSYVAVAPIIAMLWGMFWLDVPVAERRKAQLLWPLAIMVLAVLLLKMFIAFNQGHDSGPRYWGIEAAMRSFAALGWLARLALTPEARHFYYPVFEDPWLPAVVVSGVVILAASVWGAVMLLRKRSFEGFVVAAFGLLCVPHLQLIPTIPPSLVSDRYVAFSAWLAMLLLVLLAWRLKNPAHRAILLAVFALPMVFQTIVRPRDWRDGETMMEAEFKAHPGFYMPAYQKIVGYQLSRGLNRDAAETASSITVPEMRNALDGLIRSDYALRVQLSRTGDVQGAMNILLRLSDMLGKPPAQTQWNPAMLYVWKRYESMLGMQWNYLSTQVPGDALVHYNAGRYLLSIRQSENAADHLRAAIGSPMLSESLRGTALRELGVALLNSGDLGGAENALHAALQQSSPDLGAHCSLAELYRKAGRIDEATRAGAECSNNLPAN